MKKYILDILGLDKESRKEIQGSRAEDCRCQTGC